MRLVHYYPGAMGDSGVTSALWGWARAQADCGYEVAVLHAGEERSRGSEPFLARRVQTGITVQHVPHRGRHRMLMHPIGLQRFLGRRDVLVLHEGWVPTNLVAAEAARRAGIPYVVMPHGVYEPSWTTYLKPPRWLRDRLERRVLEAAAAVHVFFESEIPDIRRLAPGATFVVVPTGFDLPPERWTGGGDYLAWIGRIDPIHKGLDLLAGALALLPASDRPLVRIHGYDYKGGVRQLHELVGRLGLRRSVQIGDVLAGADKVQFLQKASGYAHPSRWECHSIALLENLALGVPCLVSSTIHVARELERSNAAILARPVAEALAPALLRLAGNSNGIGDRGRRLIRERFTWTAIVPRFQAALDRLGLN